MKILVFAPHPDDEILGCGGTMARYIEQGAEVTVCIVTSPKPPVYDNSKAVENGWPHMIYPQAKAAHELMGIKETVYLQFPCVLLENEPRHIVNGKINELIQRVEPDIVFIPHFGDMQKDHAIVAEAVMVAVRPKYKHVPRYVYSYSACRREVERTRTPQVCSFNTFVDITDYLQKKLDAMACFTSQLGEFPDPRSLEAVEALAKLRGSTSGFKAAEAFALIREYRGM